MQLASTNIKKQTLANKIQFNKRNNHIIYTWLLLFEHLIIYKCNDIKATTVANCNIDKNNDKDKDNIKTKTVNKL